MSRFPYRFPPSGLARFSAAFALIPILVLPGCATTPSIPPVQIQRVEVPVPVACINKADIPTEPGPVTLTGDARNDDALLAAKVAALRLYGRTLAAMIVPCTR